MYAKSRKGKGCNNHKKLQKQLSAELQKYLHRKEVTKGTAISLMWGKIKAQKLVVSREFVNKNIQQYVSFDKTFLRDRRM